jgi:hypothetical protein
MGSGATAVPSLAKRMAKNKIRQGFFIFFKTKMSRCPREIFPEFVPGK